MISGLEDITSGYIYFDNKIVNDLKPSERNIGMVFQNYALYPHLSVFENIAFPLKIAKLDKKVIKQKVSEIAKLVHLENEIDKLPKNLSGGQRQRVALARAIIKQPNIFLFDEPLSNLDAALRTEMRLEIMSLHQGYKVTSIYVTHDQVEAMTMGDRIVVMNNGEIQQVDTPENIYNKPANLFTASFIGQPEINIYKKDSYIFNHFISDGVGIESIGIRPEYVKINHEIGLEMSILSVEEHGFERIYILENQFGEKMKIRNKERLNLKDKIKISLENEPLKFDNKEVGIYA